jgi:hypothetical protein
MDDPPDPAPAAPAVFYGLFPRWAAAGFDDEPDAPTLDALDLEPDALQTAFA